MEASSAGFQIFRWQPWYYCTTTTCLKLCGLAMQIFIIFFHCIILPVSKQEDSNIPHAVRGFMSQTLRPGTEEEDFDTLAFYFYFSLYTFFLYVCMQWVFLSLYILFFFRYFTLCLLNQIPIDGYWVNPCA